MEISILFAAVLLAEPATTQPPYGTFWRLLGSLDLVVHCLTGVTHLVDGKGGDPLARSDAHRTTVMTLKIRHDFVLAAIAAGLKGMAHMQKRS